MSFPFDLFKKEFPGPLHFPDRAAEYRALVLCARLARMPGGLDGPSRHRLIHRLLASEPVGDSDLREWLRESLGRSINLKMFDLCREDADRWREEGIRIAVPAASAPEGIACGNACCPAVLFTRGSVPEGKPWVAVFNSRKPKSVRPDSTWLSALRFALGKIPAGQISIAGSTGTLTYDLVITHAVRMGIPLAVVVPFPILRLGSDENTDLPGAVISCLFSTNDCARATRFLCRDRLLAFLSHLHLVLELRRGGNLHSILEEVQTVHPRPLIIFDPVIKTPENAGNYQLAEKFTTLTGKFCSAGLDCRSDATKACIDGKQTKEHTLTEHPAPGSSDHVRDSQGRSPEKTCVDWGEFLFHYTRACNGPWPGQSRAEYLVSLLDADPLSAHTALDTLIRILLEWRIRSGCRLIRGTEPVVCWSSHPPCNYRDLRRWNSSLARWTVEPYGIAVRRGLLRGMGATPVIYGPESIHDLLPPSDRYRFQLSREDRCAWRNEREWRSRGDFEICRVPDGEWLAFVPSAFEKERLLERTGVALPVIAFEESLSVAGINPGLQDLQ